MSNHQITEQFREAIRMAGLVPPDTIHPDGKLHRFACDGKRGDDAGWYVLFANATPAGIFGSWRTGEKHTFRADVGHTLTADELAEQRKLIAAMRRTREEAEAQAHEKARRRASDEWRYAKPADATHPYLVRKGVQAHGLRVDGRTGG
jgi:putative DNA primase/helicase